VFAAGVFEGVFVGVVSSSSKSESYVNGPLDPGNLAIAAVGVRFVICGLTEFSRGVPRP